jgi:glycosyltransferase involved in cell wall biosynthesis
VETNGNRQTHRLDQMIPKVSVIIPVYNQAAFVRQAIDSALFQTLSPFEVIVIDDGSTDETPVVLRAYDDDPRITMIRQSNQGVAAARNAGAARARGDYLAFLDADDIWLPEKLKLQLERFSGDRGLGLVHVGVAEIDGTGNLLRERCDGLEGKVALDLMLFERSVILGGGSGAMIPQRVFLELNGFDSRLSTSADWDLYYRIAASYRVGFVPAILLQYRIHGANMHGNIGAMRHDMLLAYEKAFAAGGTELQKHRRYCYGRLHRVLAGSFFTVGKRKEALKHAAKSVWAYPPNLFGSRSRKQ